MLRRYNFHSVVCQAAVASLLIDECLVAFQGDSEDLVVIAVFYAGVDAMIAVLEAPRED